MKQLSAQTSLQQQNLRIDVLFGLKILEYVKCEISLAWCKIECG